MREQIRSLFQDDQNVQNGSSMIRTAERGIDQIVQNLRTMKELAIDAANDSNTDEDRAIIQKELNARRAVINDIAIGTQYNGKILLDGRWSRGIVALKGAGGGLNTSVQDISDCFSAGDNAVEVAAGSNGGSGDWSFDANKAFGSDKNNAPFSVKMDFTDMQVSGSYPTALHGQGFAILCSGCSQYINFRFDANKTATESTYDKTPNVAEDGTENPLAREFIIGVKNVRRGKDLAAAIFEGVSSLRNQIDDPYKSNTDDDVLVDAAHRVRIKRDSTGAVFLSKGAYSPNMQFMEGTITNPLTLPLPEVEVEIKSPNPLSIQHGTQAGQHENFFINDMRAEALGIDKAEVITREKATSAIGIIESAIESALNEATTMGAYLQRLESMNDNVITMNENVQASESTIRDSDMAKEMTEYTKYNLLAQSSQSMLAQANQVPSMVLTLLR